jgi:hypothetical protein
MTKQKEVNPFEGFAGSTVGAPETAKWEYPGIGYNASQGIFYVDEDQVESVTLVPLALRQCKEVTDEDGAVYRYPVKTPRNQMKNPEEVTYRLQIACIVDNDIYVFGARSWTARASFLNPRGGQYRDANFSTGLWYQLEDYIKAMQQNHGVATTPLCWSLELVTAPEITVGSGKNTSKSRPITVKGNPHFVGPVLVAQYEKIYQDEELAEWVAEWQQKRSKEAAAEFADEEPAVEEELPDGFAF